MKKNKKGFTLAELLIVVAIIAVLVAIAVPVFSAQLEKSKESTDMANVRSAYATLVAKYLEDNEPNSISVPGAGQDTTDGSKGWKISGGGKLQTMVDGSIKSVSFAAASSYSVKIDGNGEITINKD